jgi:hypothetical protein
MSLIKLAIYGGIGYLVYQTFFSDNPIAGRGSSQRGGSQERGGRQSFGQSRQGSGSAGGQFTGGPTGAVERTEEPSGMSSTHHVGRGVI